MRYSGTALYNACTHGEPEGRVLSLFQRFGFTSLLRLMLVMLRLMLVMLDLMLVLLVMTGLRLGLQL